MFSVWSRLCLTLLEPCQSGLVFPSATFELKETDYMQDVVDPVTDEMLAKFVVDSHFRSQAKGVTMDEKSITDSRDDAHATTAATDPEVTLSLFFHHLFELLCFFKNI